MRASLASRAKLERFEFARRRDPLNEIGSLLVTDSAIGAVLSIGLFIIVWTAIPVVRLFLIAAVGLGAVFAAVLWVGRR